MTKPISRIEIQLSIFTKYGVLYLRAARAVEVDAEEEEVGAVEVVGCGGSGAQEEGGEPRRDHAPERRADARAQPARLQVVPHDDREDGDPGDERREHEEVGRVPVREGARTG